MWKKCVIAPHSIKVSLPIKQSRDLSTIEAFSAYAAVFLHFSASAPHFIVSVCVSTRVVRMCGASLCEFQSVNFQLQDNERLTQQMFMLW